jgi:hypothetical protein
LDRTKHIQTLVCPDACNGPQTAVFKRFLQVLGPNQGHLRTFEFSPRYPGWVSTEVFQAFIDLLTDSCPKLERLRCGSSRFGMRVPRGLSQLTELHVCQVDWPGTFLQILCGKMCVCVCVSEMTVI